MTRADLIEFVATSEDITKKRAGEIVGTVIEAITTGVRTEGSVRISDFGTFKRVGRAERQGVNPRTGEAITIPASVAVKFSPAKALKEAVKK